MLTKNNLTIQKCMKSKVNSECPPSWLPLQSNYCKHFGAHPARLFPQNTFIFTYMVASFFFSKLRSHKASSPGTCWLPFFHERICHKLSICSCLSGGTWMESLVFLMSPWVVSGPFNFFVEWDVSWEKSSVLFNHILGRKCHNSLETLPRVV